MYRQSVIVSMLVFFQLTFLLTYLNANVVNVGGEGTALPLLVAYTFLSAILFFILFLKKRLYVRIHLLIFLLFVVWIAIRVAVDLGDYYYLKQITVATTGGMLLFYMSGAFLGVSYHNLCLRSNKNSIENSIIIYIFLLLIWMLYSFSQRLEDGFFYLKDVDGSYQRPGNFLSIYFILFSFLFVSLVLKRVYKKGGRVAIFLWLTIYTCSALMAIIGSQLFGSNSATAVILGVYLMTFVMALIFSNRTLIDSYLRQKLALPWSKKILGNIFLMAILGGGGFIFLLLILVSITGFDITSMRVFGFGTGSNSSLQSRINIFLDSGLDQLSYAPLLGNINVAYLTTGNAGEILHSFFPYVVANLGLVGLIIVLALFGSVFVQLYRDSKKTREVGLHGYQSKMIALYSIFILFYMIFFANLATGVSWSVLWFTLGLVSKPFGFKNEKYSYNINRIS